jgi:hypothetical protein
MLRTNITQKQCEILQKNNLAPGFIPVQSKLEPATIIQAMLKIIKIKSKDSMDAETQIQF